MDEDKLKEIATPGYMPSDQVKHIYTHADLVAVYSVGTSHCPLMCMCIYQSVSMYVCTCVHVCVVYVCNMISMSECVCPL